MPTTPKVDKKQPKKSKDGSETAVIQEKKGKKGKNEARRAEEEGSSSRKTEKKEEREKRSKGEESTAKLGSLAHGLKESQKPSKKSQTSDETTLGPSGTASGLIKGKSAAKANKYSPPRPSNLVGAHEAHVPNQKKRSRDDDESMPSTGTVAKRLKPNDGGAAATLPKVKELSAKGGKYSSREEEEIVLEDSSDEEGEGEDHIHGFSTDGDSSDNDVMVAEVPALDVSQLPTVAKDDVTVQRRLQKAKSKPVSTLDFDYHAAYLCSYRQWIVVCFT